MITNEWIPIKGKYLTLIEEKNPWYNTKHIKVKNNIERLIEPESKNKYKSTKYIYILILFLILIIFCFIIFNKTFINKLL